MIPAEKPSKSGAELQCVAVAWTVSLLVVCVRAFGWPHVHSVYPVFITAARHWRAGAGLYGPTSGVDLYRYSPFVAAVLVTLTPFTDRLGGVLWRLLNAGVLLGALAWWIRTALPRELTARNRAVVFVLVLPLSLGNLNNGQSNPLMLGLLLLAVTGAAAERWTIAALGVALASLFKGYPVAIGLLLAALYPRRFTLRFALALAGCAALPFVLQRPDYVAGQYASWFDHLLHEPRYGWMEAWYCDFRLLCRVWFVPLGVHAYLAIQLVTAAGIAAVCLAAQRDGWAPRRVLSLVFGLTCCWMTVFGLSTESATYILLGPALAWALVEARLERRAPATRALLVCSYGLLVTTQIAAWFPGMVQRVRELASQPFAGLLLFGALLFTAGRRLVLKERAGAGADRL